MIAKATRTLFSLNKDGLIASHRAHGQTPAFGQGAAQDGAVVVFLGRVDLALPSIVQRPAQPMLAARLCISPTIAMRAASSIEQASRPFRPLKFHSVTQHGFPFAAAGGAHSVRPLRSRCARRAA